MEIGAESQEISRERIFSSMFDLDQKRFQDREYVKSFSRKNLEKIEKAVEEDMARLAALLGGEYVPPAAEEIEKKFAQTLAANPFVFPSVDEDDRIWAVRKGSLYSNTENCAAFNDSGRHGVIIFPGNKEGNDPESFVRLYRGATIRVGQPQVAPLARIEGVSVQDLEDYKTGDITLENILSKVVDENLKFSLAHTLTQLRNAMAKYGTTEMVELEYLHTCYTPGALDWDLWVATAYDPEGTYRINAQSVGNIYGDFYNAKTGSVDGVMILDVPESEIKRYSNEAGIFGQIKPEWIKAIVPPHTDYLEENIKKAEELMATPAENQR